MTDIVKIIDILFLKDNYIQDEKNEYVKDHTILRLAWTTVKRIIISYSVTFAGHFHP